MTQTATPPVAGSTDPAIALADALQAGFAAQQAAQRRTSIPASRPAIP
ncbi:hypothetical protein [uncultured Modestobacter sp.]|nr:hypothetical protein [uncultured Modestobacter sp.]